MAACSRARCCSGRLYPLLSFGKHKPTSSRLAQLRRYATEPKPPKQVLSQSTLLLQDGLEIAELPLVIRRMSAAEFPFTNQSFAAQTIGNVSEQEEIFKTKLMQCINIQQVFKLLEVPGDSVTSYSASFALQRIWQLQHASNEEYDSFIRKAVLNELCETAVREIHTLPNETVIDLVQCYLSSKKYEQRYIDDINNDVEKRVGDNAFSIKELCFLLELLSTHPKSDSNVVRNIWIHFGSRYRDVDVETIATAYKTLQYMTPRFKYIFKLLDKTYNHCWWKLEPESIVSIAKIMTLCDHYSSRSMFNMSKWIFMNIHDINDDHLKHILGLFSHMNYIDQYLVRSLERYLHAKVHRMDKTVVSMVVDYFYKQRYLSPRIFNIVAADFEKNGEGYDAYQLHRTLRVFGKMNYSPPNVNGLFQKVEQVMSSNFTNLESSSLLELMASFVYMERFPVNFVKKIFSPHFVAKYLAITDSTQQQRAGRHLLELQAATFIEFPKYFISFVDRNLLGVSLTFLGHRYFKFHKDIGHTLHSVCPSDMIKHFEVPKNTPHLIDYEIIVDEMGRPLEWSSGDCAKRLAIVGIMPEYYCSNTQHMLGDHAMKLRHLQKLGYTVVQVPYADFSVKRRKPYHRKAYLIDLLEPHIDTKYLT